MKKTSPYENIKHRIETEEHTTSFNCMMINLISIYEVDGNLTDEQGDELIDML